MIIIIMNSNLIYKFVIFKIQQSSLKLKHTKLSSKLTYLQYPQSMKNSINSNKIHQQQQQQYKKNHLHYQNLKYKKDSQKANTFQYQNQIKYPQTIIPFYETQYNKSLQRMNRTESENSSQGNTLDMVRLVNKKQLNRISKINNSKLTYKPFYQERPMRIPKLRKNISENQRISPQRQFETNQNIMQSSLRSIESPTVYKSTRKINPSSNHINRVSMWRASQMRLLDSYGQYGGRNTVIGWLLLAVFVALCLQWICVGCYVVNEERLLSLIIPETQGISKDMLSNQSSQIIKESPQQLRLRQTQKVFVFGLVVYSLCQCLCHVGVYLINRKIVIDIQSNRALNNNKKSSQIQNCNSRQQPLLLQNISSHYNIYHYNNLLIDPETSTFSYIMHRRNAQNYQISNQRNELYYILSNKLFQVFSAPAFTLIFLSVSVVLETIVSVKLFSNSQMWTTLNANQNINAQNSIPLFDVFEIVFFMMILPQSITYLFFQTLHLNTQSKVNDDHVNKMNDDQQIAHFSHSLGNKTPCHLRIALIGLLISVIYSVIVSHKYQLALVLVLKLYISYIKNKENIDFFWVSLLGNLILLIVSVLVCLFDSVTVKGYLFNLMVSIVALSLSLLGLRVLANHYVREQLHRYMFSHSDMIVSLLVSSVLVYFLASYSIEYDFWFQLYEDMDKLIGMVMIVIVELILMVSLVVENKRREEISLNQNQVDNQHQFQHQYYYQRQEQYQLSEFTPYNYQNKKSIQLPSRSNKN